MKKTDEKDRTPLQAVRTRPARRQPGREDKIELSRSLTLFLPLDRGRLHPRLPRYHSPLACRGEPPSQQRLAIPARPQVICPGYACSVYLPFVCGRVSESTLGPSSPHPLSEMCE